MPSGLLPRQTPERHLPMILTTDPRGAMNSRRRHRNKCCPQGAQVMVGVANRFSPRESELPDSGVVLT